MRVRLLKDIFEHDKDGNNAGLKVAVHRGKAVPFVEGREVDMSETSAAKYIENGLAEAVEKSANEEEEGDE